jgi:hypothetical protein
MNYRRTGSVNESIAPRESIVRLIPASAAARSGFACPKPETLATCRLPQWAPPFRRKQ